ncbi:DUF3325 domain-containing protein [Sphingobium sp. EM0848]|uniref:DUF3325 domain-containing protein n=1 Tax=Sphingobium sp. EM0848 TaxID=2743473 RepID=UPI00159C6F6D|nr:DUF3325 domain-containing protein [Sphingobium sp. EM0848]
MPLEAGLVSYAALASMALASKKHRSTPPLPIMPSPGMARWAGWVMLILALVVAMLRFGMAQGMVAWIGQMCVAGTGLVLLLSWRPRLALALAAPACCMALFCLLVFPFA